jgi:GMP synthase (glutamine-hydrolysing)
MQASPGGRKGMSKTALALRHVHFEDLGAFEAPLRDAGYAIRYADAGLDDVAPFGSYDLLAVLGGPIGAYEDDPYPFLESELALITRQLEASRPLLGVCLGAQLIARAMGARVYPGPAKEIGWKVLTFTDEGSQTLAPLKDYPVLHWHGDTFDLPAGAVSLASTDICLHQAFSVGRHVLAFQFHPEAQRRGFERWLIGHTSEIAATPGVSVVQLRADTERYGDACAEQGQAVLRNWLRQLP